MPLTKAVPLLSRNSSVRTALSKLHAHWGKSCILIESTWNAVSKTHNFSNLQLSYKTQNSIVLRFHSTQYSEYLISNRIFQVIPYNQTEWSPLLIKTKLRRPLDSAKKSSQILGFKITSYKKFSCLLLYVRSKHAIIYMNNEKVHNDFAVGFKLNTTLASVILVNAFYVLNVMWICYCVCTYTDPELIELSSIW